MERKGKGREGEKGSGGKDHYLLATFPLTEALTADCEVGDLFSNSDVYSTISKHCVTLKKERIYNTVLLNYITL